MKRKIGNRPGAKYSIYNRAKTQYRGGYFLPTSSALGNRAVSSCCGSLLVRISQWFLPITQAPAQMAPDHLSPPCPHCSPPLSLFNFFSPFIITCTHEFICHWVHCLPSLFGLKFHESRIMLCSWLHPQRLEHSRFSMNIC